MKDGVCETENKAECDKISRIVSSLSERAIYLLRNPESGMQKGAQLPTPTRLRADLLISEKRKCDVGTSSIRCPGHSDDQS